MSTYLTKNPAAHDIFSEMPQCVLHILNSYNTFYAPKHANLGTATRLCSRPTYVHNIHYIYGGVFR